jgi:hypothetical protein
VPTEAFGVLAVRFLAAAGSAITGFIFYRLRIASSVGNAAIAPSAWAVAAGWASGPGCRADANTDNARLKKTEGASRNGSPLYRPLQQQEALFVAVR